MKRVRGGVAAIAAMLLMTSPAWPQQTQTPSPSTAAQDDQAKDSKSAKKITGGDRKRATKLYLQATRLFQKQQYEEARQDYEEAAQLDPGNPNYAAATEVARSHEVTELIQIAAKARIRGDKTAEHAALEKAAALDPHNVQVAIHLDEMAADGALQ